MNYFGKGVGVFFFSYFFSNFIAFQNLAFLYYFVKFKFALNYYRQDISDIIRTIAKTGDYQYFLQDVLQMNIELNIF